MSGKLYKCLSCDSPVKNKFCNTSCQNRYSNADRAKRRTDRVYGVVQDVLASCEFCKFDFIYQGRPKKKQKRFCSIRCSHRYSSLLKREEVNKKVSEKLKGRFRIKRRNEPRPCPVCKIAFYPKNPWNPQKYCSRLCQNKRVRSKEEIEKLSIAGRKSASKRTVRSKNEILMFEFCKKEFDVVVNNEKMFNGWDADIIIEDFKIAILWNGNWHYKKITKKHSLLQVQNRDAIKIKEIVRCGYVPYVIRDNGKYKPRFVKEKFEELKEFLKNREPIMGL